MAEQHTGMDLEPYLQALDQFTLRVKGNCMQPVIADRALVNLKRQNIYLPGDIVTYRDGSGQFVCHRFLGYVLWRHGWKAMTRADNSPDADTLIKPDRLLGKVMEVERQSLAVPLRTRMQAIHHWLLVISKFW